MAAVLLGGQRDGGGFRLVQGMFCSRTSSSTQGSKSKMKSRRPTTVSLCGVSSGGGGGDFCSITRNSASTSKSHHPTTPWNDNWYDEEGYDQHGFDRNGYDREGYDQEGYDGHGCDRNGYPRPRSVSNGYDQEGYDGQGYDRNGYPRPRSVRNGYDQYGYDGEGYDRNGHHADRFDHAEGTDKKPSRPKSMPGLQHAQDDLSNLNDDTFDYENHAVKADTLTKAQRQTEWSIDDLIERAKALEANGQEAFDIRSEARHMMFDLLDKVGEDITRKNKYDKVNAYTRYLNRAGEAFWEFSGSEYQSKEYREKDDYVNLKIKFAKALAELAKLYQDHQKYEDARLSWMSATRVLGLQPWDHRVHYREQKYRLGDKSKQLVYIRDMDHASLMEFISERFEWKLNAIECSYHLNDTAKFLRHFSAAQEDLQPGSDSFELMALGDRTRFEKKLQHWSSKLAED